MSKIKKIDLRSMDIIKEQKEKLRKLFPEVFTENKIDFEKLKLALGEAIDGGKERYGMAWPGKADCFKIIQSSSIGTLKPCREESVNFDTTENLFIEGDNLEVLKLLQKSYYGKVKMIYIDPPYNTGNDFIYPDDYKENLKTYLQYTGQVDTEGNKFSTNTDTEGRFHSKWLSMMYPRLFLAKNLLSDNGVIFISIDDNEISNLRKICDEIFGEENFVVACTWRKTDNQPNIGNIARVKEYIIGYTRNINLLKLNKIALTERAKKEYRYSDNKGKFRRAILLDKTRGRHIYEVITPSRKVLSGPWMKKEDVLKEMDKQGKIYWTSGGQEQPYGKIYLAESEGQIANDFLGIEYGTNQQGSLEVEKLFKHRYFDFPKPSSMIKHFVAIGTNENDIILDFFAGSATTAHAVLDLNKEDGGNRKFIMVQLPEICNENSEAYKAGFKTIADIGKERIRRVIKNIKKETGQTLFKNKKMDLGFKVFKLDRSNFKIWDSEELPLDKKSLEKQLELHIDHIDYKASQDDILYEILLKAGFKLTTKIEKIKLAGKAVYSIEGGAMFICLGKELTKEVIKAIAEKQPSRVICLDRGFANNDQLKTNAVQIMKSKSVDDFRTV